MNPDELSRSWYWISLLDICPYLINIKKHKIIKNESILSLPASSSSLPPRKQFWLLGRKTYESPHFGLHCWALHELRCCRTLQQYCCRAVCGKILREWSQVVSVPHCCCQETWTVSFSLRFPLKIFWLLPQQPVGTNKAKKVIIFMWERERDDEWKMRVGENEGGRCLKQKREH